MTTNRTDIRLALPSKGRLADDALLLLADAGLRVYKPNPRQYMATMPRLPEVTVVFQRPGDIVVSVRDGSVDFGITGRDVIEEQRGRNGELLILYDQLGFGTCTLNVIVPEKLTAVHTMSDLAPYQSQLGRPLHVATKFPKLTTEFFARHALSGVQLISAEGTLEIAPSIGYADLIVDLVSTGTTLRDNHLRMLDDGQILSSQACLIANKANLNERPDVLTIARQLLEFIIAYLRAAENVAIFANVRGSDPQRIADQIFGRQVIGGLQGPTISPVITRDGGQWHAINIIVRKDQLAAAIQELREIGGSGVIVTPVSFIFEEEPPAYRQMLQALEG
ncbi:MAG: ATP phosphoribosyltransferase [Candidatus Promineifilaceae bacterium]